ncbi:hypothetical protein [Flavobacterium sp.]|uniref:hypothetical protein n=1 Tax=Flavobacterium sp. TaxID=239 RepID=UPI003D0E4C91
MINLPIEEVTKIKYRIDKFCEFKINAFSPTISPAPKSLERNEIESIAKGIEYYIQKGITQLVFQKKYMGSYCDIYLTKNLEESYLVSRNGYKIGSLDKELVTEKLQPLHNKFDWENENLELVIIQSELMPWNALGKGLVENDFKGYLEAHQTHFDHLQQSDLYAKIEKVKQSPAYQEYQNDKNELSNTDFKQKYASHIIRQYDAIAQFIVKDFTIYEKGLTDYRAQIEHFGNEGTLEFKPFNILKKVFSDGTEVLPNDNTTFRLLNDDEMLVLDFSAEATRNENINKVYQWFENHSSQMEEGIMIKPMQSFMDGIPPAFKVRNNNYLTMIYGVDFMGNFKRNLGKRKIDSKLKCSINDWMLNWKLVQIPYHEIHSENYKLKNLVLDRILGETDENKLDMRL